MTEKPLNMELNRISLIYLSFESHHNVIDIQNGFDVDFSTHKISRLVNTAVFLCVGFHFEYSALLIYIAEL